MPQQGTVSERRWGPCPHCGTEGWYNGGLKIHPRYDHDRPDGRKCQKAADEYKKMQAPS